MNLLEPVDPTTAGVPAEGKMYMAATHFLLTPGEYDFGGGEDRDATVILLTPGEYDFGGGEDRDATVMCALEAADGVMDAQQAMDTLQSVSRELKI